MLIKKDGNKKKDIISVLLTNDRYIQLDDNQFFSVTPTGKTLELWEGDPDSKNAEGCQRICYWRMSSVISFYSRKKEEVK